MSDGFNCIALDARLEGGVMLFRDDERIGEEMGVPTFVFRRKALGEFGVMERHAVRKRDHRGQDLGAIPRRWASAEDKGADVKRF